MDPKKCPHCGRLRKPRESVAKRSFITCKRCGHTWYPQVDNPVKCPRCKGYLGKASEKALAYRRNYMRRNYMYLNVDGKIKVIKVKGKREYTNRCELCGTERRISYHHWDDLKPADGMWLCNPCHVFAGKVENGVVEKYLLLKKDIMAGKV